MTRHDICYSSQWKDRGLVSSTVFTHLPSSHFCSMAQPVDSGLDVAMATPSPFVGYTYMDPGSVSSLVNNDVKHLQISAAMSPASPASSISSFSIHSQLGKTCPNSGTIAKSKTMTSSLPEAHALSRTLALSDSSLNYFSDGNYSSVSLCACDITGLGKAEHQGSSKRKGFFAKTYDFGKCVCGFAQLEAEKFSKGIGLFPEDERELAQPCISKQRRTSVASLNNNSQPVFPGIKQEAGHGTAGPQAAGASSPEDSVTASLVEILVEQCSSPFSCSTMESLMSQSAAKQAADGMYSFEKLVFVCIMNQCFKVMFLVSISGVI